MGQDGAFRRGAEEMTRRRCSPRVFAALLAAAALPAALPAPAIAQFNASIYATSTYDDNSWAFYEKRADVYHQIFLSLSRDFGAEYSFHQAFYYGARVLFRTYHTRTYNQQTAGLYSEWQLDYLGDDGDEEEENAEDEEDAGDAGEETRNSRTVPRESSVVRGPARRDPALPPRPPADAFNDSLVTYLITKPFVSGRFDRKEFAFYDFRRAALNVLLRRHIAGPLMGRLQYEFGYKQYPSFVQFTHIENEVSSVLNFRILPATEVYGSAGFGLKSYTETVYDTVFIEVGNGGKGKGGVKPKKKIVSEYSTPAAGQLALSLGVVQTAAPGVVLGASWARRINTADQARYLDRRGRPGATEDEIFEDRYGYEADEALLTFSAVVAGRLTLEAEAGAAARRYPRNAADLYGEDLPGSPQRRDSRYSFIIRAAHPLFSRADGSAFLSLGAGYRYLRNSSNDAYHDYHVNQAWISGQVNM